MAADVDQGLWNKIECLRAKVRDLEETLCTEQARRRLAERRLEVLQESRGRLPSWEAYADIEGQMRRLHDEPRQGTLAWRHWLNRSVDQDFREVLAYCHDMAREGRRGAAPGTRMASGEAASA